jgi:hypothetical protein
MFILNFYKCEWPSKNIAKIIKKYFHFAITSQLFYVYTKTVICNTDLILYWMGLFFVK